MLARPRPGSGRRVVAALAVALGVAACATRIEPPVIVASSQPAGTEARLTGAQITARTIELRDTSAGTVRINAVGDDVLHFFDADQGQVTSERVTVTSDGVVFEGNVRIEYDGTSIATNRAVFKEALDSRTTLSMDDAVVTRDEAR